MIFYVIRSVSDNNLFWSNDWGWGGRRGCAIYNADEYYSSRNNLPLDGEWIQAEPPTVGQKWAELPKVFYTFVTDSQDLSAILAYLGIVEFAGEVSAALVSTGEGEYNSVYLSDGIDFKRSVDWLWYKPEYFADSVPDELELQDLAQICGECASTDARWTFDPYLSDIHDEMVMGWWCDDCYDNRNDDI